MTLSELSYEQLVSLAQYAKSRITRGWLMSPQQAFDERYRGIKWEAPRG